MIGSPSRLLATKVETRRLLLGWCNGPRRTKATMTIKSHPFHYLGDLLIEGQCLVFRGHDLSEEVCHEEVIPFERIIEVILPFDEHLQVFVDPWLGIGGPIPFIVRYQNDNEEQTVYFNT